jgi:hypothetical protein
MMYQRDIILTDLRENVIEVTFTKVNGEQRVMRCTLRTDLLPKTFVENVNEQKEEKEFHQKNPDVIASWDVQKGGWRSFKVDSVEYLQIIDGY